ncbi:MAG: type II toxin-antitoxin system prevent-host-death family antitoxin [Pseudomonadota bacterium]
MGTVTAKQLKQKTGDVIKRVRQGERFTITYRGKPIAVIEPPHLEEKEIREELGSSEEAWKNIEQTLENTAPAFKDWREATEWVRRKS